MNGSLAEQLRAALNAARKERDQARTLLFSTILSDVRNREIELAKTLEDAETVEVLRRGGKRRKVTALEAFLPPGASDDEIRTAAREAIGAGAKDLGSLMGKVMPLFKGRADGKAVGRIAREELAAAS